MTPTMNKQAFVQTPNLGKLFARVWGALRDIPKFHFCIFHLVEKGSRF